MPTHIKILLLILVSILFLSVWVIHLNKKFYNSVFRLSYSEVVDILKNKPSECLKLSECSLQPGDIIIRRYITERTRIFQELLNPYYTHSAVYIGNDELFEALGDDETPENQVRITKFSESDWFKQDMDNFVVVRPKNYSGKLDSIMDSFRDIANDKDYVFGFPKADNKKTTCADAIVKTLEIEGIFSNLSDMPEVITPDYLFLITERDEENFEIVGYSNPLKQNLP